MKNTNHTETKGTRPEPSDDSLLREQMEGGRENENR